MRRITKLFNTKATSIDADAKTVTFTISDNGVDRMGEIVDQKSWNFKDYLKNPIVLFGHDPSMPENVLGTAQSLELSKDGNSTLASLKFDTDINPKAALVFNQVCAGTLRCVSVGFINHSEEMDNDTPILKDNDLLEISVVPIPANPRAIALSLKEGTISTKDATWLMDSMKKEMTFIEEQLEQDQTKDNKDSTVMNEQATKQLSAMLDAVTALTKAQAETNERIDTLATSLDAVAAGLQEKSAPVEPPVETPETPPAPEETEEPVEKSAISSSLPTADPDVAWDSGEAIKAVKAWASDADGNIDFSKYRKAFFWEDGDGTKQGDFKLPFADVVDGKLLAVWKGVAAAYAAVKGARGGVDGIDDDAVLAQIKKYYKKFGKDWPEKSFDLANPDVTTKDITSTDTKDTDATDTTDDAPKDDTSKDTVIKTDDAADTTTSTDDSTTDSTADTSDKTDETTTDPAKGGSDDQPGAGDDEELDPEAELTPELQEQLDKQLEAAVVEK